jgi:hypothetical protein
MHVKAPGHADLSVYIEAVNAMALPREFGLRVGER